MNEMRYKSTRDDSVRVSAAQAILAGISDEGGLFVPEQIPPLGVALEDLPGLSYQETAFEVLRPYLTDFTEEELKGCIASAYDSKFDTADIAPLVKADKAYYLELYHGATLAFKDMALSILPHFLTLAAKKCGEEGEVVILTATSGDTGKAALAGFANVPGTRIIVFYPKHGVSPVQELQMVTQEGANTHVVGIRGNFDDAQNGVKRIFTDAELKERMAKKGYRFSSANSINIGRLLPQIVYYVHTYGQLCKRGAIHPGDAIHVVVPTGNFGNILAAHYAKRMGLPIAKLICASNENKVLTDFFASGTYDKNREFLQTSSPSMDILISSNLERLIYEICGENASATKALMEQLAKEGSYEITPEMKERLSEFVAGYATEEQMAKAIKRTYENAHYIIDPHTAVAASVYRDYRKRTQDPTPALITATASPFKFPKSVVLSINKDYGYQNELELVRTLSDSMRIPVPGAVRDLKDARILHDTVCDPDQMKQEVEKYLGL